MIVRAKARMAGTTRRSSSRAEIFREPGRLDSPPTSMISAPSLTKRRASLNARLTAFGELVKHPSPLKESGVIFRIPMIYVRLPSCRVCGPAVTMYDDRGWMEWGKERLTTTYAFYLNGFRALRDVLRDGFDRGGMAFRSGTPSICRASSISMISFSINRRAINSSLSRCSISSFFPRS